MGLNLEMDLESCRPMTLHIGTFGVAVRGYFTYDRPMDMSVEELELLSDFEEYVVKDGDDDFYGCVTRRVNSMVSYGNTATIYLEYAIDEYFDRLGDLTLEYSDGLNWIER